MDYDFIDIIKYIPPSSLDYQEWLDVGMALKHEGYSCDIWDSWSMNDSRYKPGVCAKKWETFNGSENPVTGGTLIELAKSYGYNPVNSIRTFDWDDEIGVDKYDTAWVEPETIENEDDYEDKAIDDIIRYLDVIFKDDDKVGIVAESYKDEDGKYKPGGKGTSSRTKKQLIEEINKCKAKGIYDYNEIISRTGIQYNPAAGAWIRFNPLDGKGVKNENITEYRYALVESDSLEIEKQYGIIKEMSLPVAALVHSGGKSLHAIVKINAPTLDIYKERVEKLYKICDNYGLKVDKQNKNPSRLSRLPGIRRGKNWQKLLETNIGSSSWHEWEEFINEVLDDLPDPEDLFDRTNEAIELQPEVIEGVLRKGRKMILTGASKAGKSFLLVELAMALATGSKWLGFKCRESKVLYINFEIPKDSFTDRLRAVSAARGMTMRAFSSKFDCLSLRGYARQFRQLLPSLKHKVKKGVYDVVIIDPIYKTLLGDENDARVVAEFCNALDSLSTETGATIIFCHHHSKSAGEGVAAQNRSSGSGVFARDPDAIIDLLEIVPYDTDGTPLEVKIEDFNGEECRSRTFMRLESSLREFEPLAPFEIVFNYPAHYVVKGLEKAKSAGQVKSGSIYTKKERSNMGVEKVKENKEKRIERIVFAAQLLKGDLPPTLEEVSDYFQGAYGYSKDTIEKLAADSANPLRIKEQTGVKYVLVDEPNQTLKGLPEENGQEKLKLNP